MEPVHEHLRERVNEIEQAVLRKLELGHCTMEELIRDLPGYSWNQVFTAVDQLSREGALMIRYSPRVDLYLLSARHAMTG